MIQPACVLPSNASPLVGGTEPGTRVLQEHSGNRQHQEYKLPQDYDQKYSASSVSENPPARIPVRTQHLYRTPYHSSQPWRSGFTRLGYGRSHYPTQAEKDERARRLLRRFHACEGYSKYRARQVKHDEKSGEQMWPDHLEHAFCRALVEYPPMGRKKQLVKEKQRGRNELIAAWIEMSTGVSRDRKQVSSHIQVLKPFVQTDSLIMAYLSKSGEHEGASRHHNGYPANHANGRGLSRYPVQAPPQNGHQMMPFAVSGDTGSQVRIRDVPEIFVPVSFEMFVQRKLRLAEQPEDESVQRVHTYTKQISQPWEADDMISDWNDLVQRHPDLATIHSQRPIDCNVVAAKASLAIHSGPWKDQDGDAVDSSARELGISFNCRAGNLPRPFEVMYRNHFYERGKLVEEVSCAHQFLNDNSTNDLQVMFGSTYWVHALCPRYKQACQAGPGHGAAFIGSITATQEIFIKTQSGVERVMLIHWSFRQSQADQGRTCWRRVVMPSSLEVSQYASPLKSMQMDNPFDFNDDPMPNLTASGVPPQPALQSPFEYESGSTSAPSSATWPTSISDATGAAFADATLDTNLDNTFDFTGGKIDISYNPNLNLDDFDTSAFNFDATADSFAADTALPDYSQTWDAGFADAGSFDGQQSFADTNYSIAAGVDGQNGGFDDYGVFDPQIYDTNAESQAFGGAGQDAVKEEGSLSAAVVASNPPPFKLEAEESDLAISMDSQIT